MVVRCYFDDALPRLAAVVSAVLGEPAVQEHLFLRDAAGRLTLVLLGESPRQRYNGLLDRLASLAHAAVAPYIEAPEFAVATPDELFATEDLAEAGTWEWLDHAEFTGFVRVFERRIVGQDWLTPPQPQIEGAPPIVVFASHKGGVGRSTALVVAAADIAARGHNILALDLDLEAPGLGGMLLPEDRTPAYGAIDFFVENGLGLVDEAFSEKLYGVSPLTQGKGLVHVVPAVGRRSGQDPQNLLAKLSRAYLEDSTADGTKTFLQQSRDLIRLMTQRQPYDVVLVDARAGLHETTAAAILGLGADVLLFGIDTPQTFLGYRFLLAHLARFKPSEPTDDDWRLRLRLVHAKAAADSNLWRGFNDRAYSLFSEHLYDADEGVSDEEGTPVPLNFDLDAPEAPHVAWRILSDAGFAEFDPPTHPEQLAEPVYERTFGKFLAALRERMELS